ncbi:MAG: type VI secretion system protein TssA [Betaproteobacteria bacterium]|nr:type VI secretion system protein TssA [Betaproteobacteria bacterium]
MDRLTAPISQGEPCGPDLEYDADFLALEQAARGKGEQQFGDTVVPAQEPDWRDVLERATALLGRSKDLRVAVMLARACARVEGVAGYVQALQLIHSLCEQYWAEVHPLLDTDDEQDPTVRMNALSVLAHPEAGLRDLKAALLVRTRGGQASIRDLEYALGLLTAPEGVSHPGETEIVAMLADDHASGGAAAATLGNAAKVADDLQALLNDKVGSDRSADLGPVRDLLRAGARLAARVTGAADAGTEEAAEGAASAGAAAPITGDIRSREDALRVLDRVCEFLERHEPTNPAPLFIRRAQRLMGMNFVDIIRDLVPDSVSQLETLAGLNRE